MIHNITKRLVKLIQISLYAVFAKGSRSPVDQTYANASSREGIYAVTYLRIRGFTGRFVHSSNAAIPIRRIMALSNSCQLPLGSS